MTRLKLLAGPRVAAALFALLPPALFAATPRFVEAPRVIASRNSSAPLAAVVRFKSDLPVATRISISSETTAWELSYDASHEPEKGLPIVGLVPGENHTVRVSIRPETNDASSTMSAGILRAPRIPDNRETFPPLTVTTSKLDQLEPGFVLFNPRRRRPGRQARQFGQGFGMLLVVDYEGRPRWYYRTDSRISDFEVIDNGNLVYVTQDFRLVEIDWLGNPVRQWYAAGRPQGEVQDAIRVDGTLTFHHEIDELPNGNLVVLGSEIREIDNYYTSETDPNAPRRRQKVMGDVILEFEKDTGKVVWRWSAFEYLDPFRIGYETFSGYWERRGFPGVIDWSHANNLLYDQADDSLIINFRYQSAAVKIDRATKAIKWIFGEPTGWGKLSKHLFQSEGDLRWPYHHHAPSPTPEGTLLIFDNGNFQALPFAPRKPIDQIYSRAVEYRLDEKQRTAREVWSSEESGPRSVRSVAMGDVEWLPQTGNVLVAYGMLMQRSRAAATGGQLTRIRQFRRSTPAEILWELELHDRSEEDPVSWALFGAEHLPNWQAQ